MTDKYKHHIRLQVKFDEVDSFGVVHNIQYFRYLEWARIKYLEALGMPVNSNTFSNENLLMVVHQEIDYLSPAKFYDYINIYSRTERIGDSSMSVDNIITNDKGDMILKAKVVMVNIDEETRQTPKSLSKEFVEMINKYDAK